MTSSPSLGQRVLLAWLRANPAYLLSALAMLIGCYLLLEPGGSRSRSAEEVWLSLLVVTLYKLGLLAGLWLGARSSGPPRETLLLTGVMTLFLGDCLFLGHAFQQLGPRMATAGSLALLALAAIELWCLGRALRVGLPWSTCGFVWLSLAVFLGLPRLLVPLLHAGALGAQQLTLAAWLVVGPWLLLGLRRSEHPLGSLIEGVFCLLGPLHLGAALLVCSAAPQAGMLAPFCFAGAWVLLHRPAEAAGHAALFCLLLGIGLGAGSLLWFVAALVAGRALWQGRSAWLASAGALAVYRIGRAGWLPETTRGWGAVTVVLAFVLLALGLLTTALRERVLGREVTS